MTLQTVKLHEPDSTNYIVQKLHTLTNYSFHVGKHYIGNEQTNECYIELFNFCNI